MIPAPAARPDRSRHHLAGAGPGLGQLSDLGTRSSRTGPVCVGAAQTSTRAQGTSSMKCTRRGGRVSESQVCPFRWVTLGKPCDCSGHLPHLIRNGVNTTGSVH